MSRNGSGVYSKPANTTAVPNTTIESAKYNTTIDDIVVDLNLARPIIAGGTGATTADGARTNLGFDNILATNDDLSSLLAVYPENMAALKALDVSLATTAVIKDEISSYLYTWKLGDYSAQQAADKTESRIIKANAVPINTGAWVRIEAPNDKLVDGREYLWPYLNKAMTSTDCRIVLSGDSTTEGVGITDTVFLPQNLLSTASVNFGMKNQSVINEGHSSQHTGTWDATYVSADLAQDPDLYILRWGINDASAGRSAADFEASLRSGLTKIRAHANGSIDNCSVILMVPNTISEPTYGRDEAWVEEIRPIIRKAARDFQCLYMDTYELLRDGETGTGRWLDNPSSNGGIHPTNIMNAQIWGWVAENLWSMSMPGRVNASINVTGSATAINATIAPSNFPFGESKYRTGTGYPFDGSIFTTRHVDGPAIQLGSDYQANPNGWVRVANTVGNAWSAWTLMTSVVSSAIVASTGFSIGTGNQAPKALREGNMVFCRGWITMNAPAALGTGTGICTLPVGLRPYGESLSALHIANGSGAYEIIPVQTNAAGQVVLRGNTTISASVISLDMISFDVTPS